MQLHFQNREYFSVTCDDGFSLDIINKPFDLNYSFLCMLTFCDLFCWVDLVWNHGEKSMLFSDYAFILILLLLNQKIYYQGSYYKKLPLHIRKGSLQNHTYHLSRAISLEVLSLLHIIFLLFSFIINNIHTLNIPCKLLHRWYLCNN